MGFEVSGSREVGIGGVGVRRSGLVVRHIDFQIGETSIYECLVYSIRSLKTFWCPQAFDQ